jgi:hypothetical protein
VGNKSPKLPDHRESLGKYQDFPSPKIQFSSHEIRFSSTAFCFLQQLSTYFNGFLIFLNGFPIFLNGFPLSKKSKKIYLRQQIYKSSPFELCISRHSLPELCNRHSLSKLCNCHLLPELCNRYNAYISSPNKSTLDQQPTPTKQSHLMQAISNVNNHGHFAQEFWVQVFTELDASMQSYTFELDEESQDLCTFITPFVKYKYSRLPMGLNCSPDIAQAIMENVLSDIEDADIYIVDGGAFCNDWNHHVKLLATILHCLHKNGFNIDPLKCEWAVKETVWFGYWLTPCGLKPWKKKINAILHIHTDCPCNTTELCMFIDCLNYYCDVWPSHAHILKPLTDQSGLKKKAPMNWIDKMQKALIKMHLLMAANVLAGNPDHKKRFDIYTDASDFQIGVCIIQEGRPVAYFSCKLTKSQQNYTTMEKEMLPIIGMLLGADLHVFTDHKNLTLNSLKMQCILCWHTKIEGFSPMLHYIAGPRNILVNNLSWLHCLVTPAQIMEGKKLVEPAAVSNEGEDKEYFLDQEHSDGICNNVVWECIECYLNLPNTPHPNQNLLN